MLNISCGFGQQTCHKLSFRNIVPPPPPEIYVPPEISAEIIQLPAEVSQFQQEMQQYVGDQLVMTQKPGEEIQQASKKNNWIVPAIITAVSGAVLYVVTGTAVILNSIRRMM